MPCSSHWGGVWERQIRTTRSILNTILNEYKGRLDTSSLRTFLYEVMAIINSRPLTCQCLNDPKSLEPLTPNHLLTMKNKTLLPPPGNFVKRKCTRQQLNCARDVRHLKRRALQQQILHAQHCANCQQVSYLSCLTLSF